MRRHVARLAPRRTPAAHWPAARQAPGRRWARAALAVLALALTVALPAAAASAAPNLRVRGTVLVDGAGRGHAVRLLGVNRSGLEYACIQGWGFFDSPHPDQIDTPAMIAAMKTWRINTVRVPLNEDCWLGINTPAGRGGSPYRRIVQRYVQALNAAGLYVILDLHLAAPGSTPAQHLVPMADADHAPAFWRSVARTFSRDHALIFDLFNEPHAISWDCWRNGCAIPAGPDWPAYQAAGTQALVSAVRSTGAKQPLLLGGTAYSLDLSAWNSQVPHDPAGQLVASDHNYGGLGQCGSSCQSAVLATARHHPVVFGELGEIDCRHSYIDSLMAFADRHGIGYLGWAWDAVAPGSWTCTGGPSLINGYGGTPTAFGIGLRDHLRRLFNHR